MVFVQFPLPLATVVPSEVGPARNSSTVLLASAVPLNVGVVTLVMLSVLEVPVSVAAVRSGVEGAAGGVLSTVNVVLGPAPSALFPAVSAAVSASIEMPSVPLPVTLERVTERVVVPVPETTT